jgi:hypothetical protein
MEGREFGERERRCATRQEVAVRCDAAKRQKIADIDTKLTALLGDVKWLPQVRGSHTILLSQHVRPFEPHQQAARRR